MHIGRSGFIYIIGRSRTLLRDRFVSGCNKFAIPHRPYLARTAIHDSSIPIITTTSNMSGYTLLTILVSSLVAAAPTPHLASAFHADRRAIPTPDYWAPSPKFTSMSEYNVSSFAAGATNLAIMRGSPSAGTDGSTANMQEAFSTFTTNWNESVNSLQILYPKGSNAPRNDPQGGTEFYAHPLDLLTARNVTLQYSVYFPSDFDFVKGGKLPGMYGGHKGCSGGNSAVE